MIITKQPKNPEHEPPSAAVEQALRVALEKWTLTKLPTMSEQAISSEVDDAFRVIGHIADRAREHAGALEFLSDGGPIALDDSAYIDGLLTLVNKPGFDDKNAPGLVAMVKHVEAQMNAGGKRRKVIRDERYRSIPVTYMLFESDRQELISCLSDILASPETAYANYGNTWIKALRNKVISIHRFSGAEPDLRVIPDRETARAYVLLLLTRPPHDRQLRRCQVDQCGKFFMDNEIRTGPRREYCSQECAALGRREKGRQRVKEWRAAQKTKIKTGRRK